MFTQICVRALSVSELGTCIDLHIGEHVIFIAAVGIDYL